MVPLPRVFPELGEDQQSVLEEAFQGIVTSPQFQQMDDEARQKLYAAFGRTYTAPKGAEMEKSMIPRAVVDASAFGSGALGTKGGPVARVLGGVASLGMNRLAEKATGTEPEGANWANVTALNPVNKVGALKNAAMRAGEAGGAAAANWLTKAYEISGNQKLAKSPVNRSENPLMAAANAGLLGGAMGGAANLAGAQFARRSAINKEIQGGLADTYKATPSPAVSASQVLDSKGVMDELGREIKTAKPPAPIKPERVLPPEKVQMEPLAPFRPERADPMEKIRDDYPTRAKMGSPYLDDKELKFLEIARESELQNKNAKAVAAYDAEILRRKKEVMQLNAENTAKYRQQTLLAIKAAEDKTGQNKNAFDAMIAGKKDQIAAVVKDIYDRTGMDVKKFDKNDWTLLRGYARKSPEEIYDVILNPIFEAKTKDALPDAAKKMGENLSALTSVMGKATPEIKKGLGNQFVSRLITESGDRGFAEPEALILRMEQIGRPTINEMLGNEKAFDSLRKLAEIAAGQKTDTYGKGNLLAFTKYGLLIKAFSDKSDPVKAPIKILPWDKVIEKFATKKTVNLLAPGNQRFTRRAIDFESDEASESGAPVSYRPN